MEPLYIYSRTGFTFTLYPNRIKIERQTSSAETEVLLLSNIASVSVEGLVIPKLIIKLVDGKKHEFQLGRDNEQARQAITNAL